MISVICNIKAFLRFVLFWSNVNLLVLWANSIKNLFRVLPDPKVCLDLKDLTDLKEMTDHKVHLDFLEREVDKESKDTR